MLKEQKLIKLPEQKPTTNELVRITRKYLMTFH